MIEAFEIGVSLALQDGISDSNLRAQQSVAALQSAVRSSDVSIQALREAGVKAASVGGGEPKQMPVQQPDILVAREAPSGDASPSSQIQTDAAPRQDAMLEQTLPKRGDLDVAGAPAAEEKPQSRLETVTGDWPDRLAVGRTNGAASAPAHLISKSERLDTQLPAAELMPTASFSSPSVDRPSSSAAPADVTPGKDAAVTAAPFAQSDMIVNRLDQVNWANNQSAHVLPGRGDPHTTNIVYQDEKSGLQPNVRTADGERAPESVAPNVSWAAVPEQDAARQSNVMPETDEGADRGAGIALHATLRTLSPRATNAQQSAAPHGSERQREHFGGDVYLDGMLVGRWMSKFLRREAERAESGPTGFDAKRSRLLPGVTVGG